MSRSKFWCRETLPLLVNYGMSRKFKQRVLQAVTRKLGHALFRHVQGQFVIFFLHNIENDKAAPGGGVAYGVQ